MFFIDILFSAVKALEVTACTVRLSSASHNILFYLLISASAFFCCRTLKSKSSVLLFDVIPATSPFSFRVEYWPFFKLPGLPRMLLIYEKYIILVNRH